MQSKLAAKLGGVQKSSKKGKKGSRAAALQALEAAPPAEPADHSPVSAPSPTSSSPRGAEDQQEPGAELAGSISNHDSISQPAASDEGRAGGRLAPENATNNSSEAEGQKSASAVSSVSHGDSPGGRGDSSGPGSNSEADLEDSIDPPQGVKAVPSSAAFRRLVRASVPLDPDSSSSPEAVGGAQGGEPTPSKNTPSKATPNKRPREAVGSSPAAKSPAVGVEQHRGPEGGLLEGTPGKRRRSLLPQSPVVKKGLPSWHSQVHCLQGLSVYCKLHLHAKRCTLSQCGNLIECLVQAFKIGCSIGVLKTYCSSTDNMCLVIMTWNALTSICRQKPLPPQGHVC